MRVDPSAPPQRASPSGTRLSIQSPRQAARTARSGDWEASMQKRGTAGSWGTWSEPPRLPKSSNGFLEVREGATSSSILPSSRSPRNKGSVLTVCCYHESFFASSANAFFASSIQTSITLRRPPSEQLSRAFFERGEGGFYSVLLRRGKHGYQRDAIARTALWHSPNVPCFHLLSVYY